MNPVYEQLVADARESETQGEVVRKLYNLPRYTHEQVILLARKDAVAWLQRLSLKTIDDLTVDKLKAVLRQPAESVEEITELAQEITALIARFFEDNDFVDFNPLWTYRWYLALMDEHNYISVANTLHNISEKFSTSRDNWVQGQVDAIQSEMRANRVSEAEFAAATEEIQMAGDEVGEA